MSKKCPCCGAIMMVLVKGTVECFKCPFVCAIKDFPSIAAAMEAEARHNALVEAVKKEHVAFDALDDAGFQLGPVGDPIWTNHAAARAEVDRLIGEGEG